MARRRRFVDKARLGIIERQNFVVLPVHPPPESGITFRDALCLDVAAVCDVLAGGGLRRKRGGRHSKASLASLLGECNLAVDRIQRRFITSIMHRHERPHYIHCYRRCLHVEPCELDPPLSGAVELAHPEDHVQNLFGVPCPEIHPLQKLFWVAVAVQNKVV